MRIRIAPSLLSADFARLAEALAVADAGGADLVHVDVMDGHFVPNLTIGPPVVRALRRATRLPLDVHLMIERPEATLAEYLDAGADWVSVHVEATHHLQRCLDTIRRAGAKAGAAINPATPTLALSDAWADLDYSVVMSVNPGWGGPPFLRPSIAEAGPGAGRLSIEVDGGVGADNAAALAEAGAEILVAGTAIYGAEDPAGAIGLLRDAAQASVRA